MIHRFVIHSFARPMTGALTGAVLSLAMLAGTGLPAGAQSARTQNHDAWLKASQLGPHAPAKEDWDAVAAKARTEPPLQVYMTSSRVKEAIKAFSKLYPDVKVEGVNIPAAEMQQRVRLERGAGNYNIGLLHADTPETYLATFGNQLVPYVPPEMKATIPQSAREPLLIYRYLPTGVTYNPKTFPDGPPTTNIWELTTEKFAGKVVIADPLQTGSILSYLVTLVGKETELLEAYKAQFGQAPKLREKTIGWEFIRRLLANRPVIVGGTRDVAEAISNSTALMVGFNNFSRAREVASGRYNFTFIMGLKPFDMVNLPTHLSIMAGSPSPNAAKLFVRHMLTDKGGAPWFNEGNPPARTDWVPEQGWIKPILKHTKAEVDYKQLLATTDDFIDFWTVNLKKR